MEFNFNSLVQPVELITSAGGRPFVLLGNYKNVPVGLLVTVGCYVTEYSGVFANIVSLKAQIAGNNDLAVELFTPDMNPVVKYTDDLGQRCNVYALKIVEVTRTPVIDLASTRDLLKSSLTESITELATKFSDTSTDFKLVSNLNSVIEYFAEKSLPTIEKDSKILSLGLLYGKDQIKFIAKEAYNAYPTAK